MIVAIPALVAILLNHEKQKGSPLTEQEVLDIRDKAVCMTMPPDVAAEVAEKRGYDDISLDHPWEGWQAIRPSLEGN